VYFRARGSSLEGSVQIPIELLAKAVDSDLGPDATLDDLRARGDAIESLMATAFTLSENGAALDLRFGELRTVETGAGRFCAVSYSAPGGALPRTVRLSIEGLLEIDHHVSAVGVVSINRGWGKFGRRIRDQHRLDHHHTARDISLTEPTFVDHLTTTMQGILRRGKNRVSAANRP